MPINITVGQGDPKEKERKIMETVKLDIRKDMAGNFIVSDHSDIDILIVPQNNKIIAFAKDESLDLASVYSAQDRLFDFLFSKGVIRRDTVEGGNVFGSMEAEYYDTAEEDVSALQVVIFALSRFIDEERPYYMFRQAWDDDYLDRYVHPDSDESTELGEVPQAAHKGSIDQWNANTGRNYRVYQESIERDGREEKMYMFNTVYDAIKEFRYKRFPEDKITPFMAHEGKWWRVYDFPDNQDHVMIGPKEAPSAEQIKEVPNTYLYNFVVNDEEFLIKINKAFKGNPKSED